jgi:hypothetical protein
MSPFCLGGGQVGPYLGLLALSVALGVAQLTSACFCESDHGDYAPIADGTSTGASASTSPSRHSLVAAAVGAPNPQRLSPTSENGARLGLAPAPSGSNGSNPRAMAMRGKAVEPLIIGMHASWLAVDTRWSATEHRDTHAI